MNPRTKLTLVLNEVRGFALVKCPEFGISAFADSVDEAKQELFANVRTASNLMIDRKQRGLSVDEELLPFAHSIIKGEDDIREYFNEVRAS
jgi:hypothetical protein